MFGPLIRGVSGAAGVRISAALGCVWPLASAAKDNPDISTIIIHRFVMRSPKNTC